MLTVPYGIWAVGAPYRPACWAYMARSAQSCIPDRSVPPFALLAGSCCSARRSSKWPSPAPLSFPLVPTPEPRRVPFLEPLDGEEPWCCDLEAEPGEKAASLPEGALC